MVAEKGMLTCCTSVAHLSMACYAPVLGLSHACCEPVTQGSHDNGYDHCNTYQMLLGVIEVFVRNCETGTTLLYAGKVFLKSVKLQS